MQMFMAAPMGQDEQIVPGAGSRAAVMSYGSRRDCGPGPVLSGTGGMGQLKEPHHKQSLVG